MTVVTGSKLRILTDGEWVDVEGVASWDVPAVDNVPTDHPKEWGDPVLSSPWSMIVDLSVPTDHVCACGRLGPLLELFYGVKHHRCHWTRSRRHRGMASKAHVPIKPSARSRRRTR